MADEKIRKKRKKMYPLLAPQFLNERIIGETPLDDIALLKGKQVTSNLFNLMGDMKRQYVELSFKVENVRENKGYTDIVGYKLSNAFIKRMVRRGRSKVDDSFYVKDAKGVMIQIKPMLITLGKAPNSIKTRLLKFMRAEILQIIQQVNFEQFVKDLLDHKVQKGLKERLTKRYPVKQVEIRFAAVTNVNKETIHAKIATEEAKEEVDEHDEKIQEKIRKTQEKKEKAKEDPELEEKKTPKTE